MDTLFHFIFPMIVFLASGIKIKHKIMTAVILGLLASMFIDSDHFFGLSTRGTFHNIFITLLIPITIFVIAMKYERKSNYWKYFGLALTLAMFSHPIADMFDPNGLGVQLFYPFSNAYFNLNWPTFQVPLPSGQLVYVVSSGGLGLFTFFMMILGIIFVEDFIRILKKEKKVEKAVGRTIKYEERKIKREL